MGQPGETAPVDYPFPPITEAVIQFGFDNELEISEQKKVSEKLGQHYPNENLDSERTVELNLKTEKIKIEETDSIIRRSNSDEDQICVVRKSSLATSKLPNYDGWNNLYSRATRDFETSKSITGFRKISRLGVRYINRIDLPFEEDDLLHLEKYFNIYFTHPEEFGHMNSSSWRSEHEINSLDALLLLNIARVDSPLPRHMGLLFDIDVVKLVDVPQKDNDIFSYLKQARDFKNMVFEKSITDETRRRFFDDLRIGD